MGRNNGLSIKPTIAPGVRSGQRCALPIVGCGGCGELGNRQYHQLQEFVRATTIYETRRDQLVLVGDDVRIVTVIDNSPLPTALKPTSAENVVKAEPTSLPENSVVRQPIRPLLIDADPRLTEKLWRLAAITQRDATIQFDALEDTYFIFKHIGYLYLHIAPLCGGAAYPLAFWSKDRYQIIQNYRPELACSDTMNEQMKRMLDAVGSTTHYKLRNGQLVLIGEDTQVILEDKGPLRPLIPGVNSVLSRIRWQLTEATQWGLSVDYDAIGPIHVSFDIRGNLLMNAARCNAVGYQIVALNEGRYRLIDGVSTAVGCGELGDAQSAYLSNALKATTEYTIQDSRLLLTGNGVRMVLEYEQQFPPIPSVTPALFLNRWRWVEITFRNETVTFDDIKPVSTNFDVGGSLSVNPTDCIDGSYLIIANSDRHYQLVRRMFSDENCRKNGKVQFEQLIEALEATTTVELHADQLLLTGDDIRIILEIDNAE